MKTYDIENKIKSSKWNAFLLRQKDVEEYLEDGKFSPSEGFFSRFSKIKKENDARRNKRMVDLLTPRIIDDKIEWEEYVKHNIVKLDKEITSMIIEPMKNVFNREASFIFKGIKEDNNTKLKKLVNEGKIESGDIVAIYPISVIQNGVSKGVLFITTTGICFVSINAGNKSTIAPYAVANAFGGLGAIAIGVSAMASKYISHSIENYKMDKEQKTIIELSDKYSPCLIAKCFEDSQFIPYKMINAFIHGTKTEKNKFAFICIYQNIQKKVIFEVDQNIMDKVVKNLSGDLPPKAKKYKK